MASAGLLMHFGVDTTQIALLANDLKIVRSRLKPALNTPARNSARKVRDDARANWRNAPGVTGKTTSYYPASITFEKKTSTGSLVEYEVGPDKELPQGALGNLFEYGLSTPRRGLPKPHLGPALDAEAAVFERALLDAVVKAIL